jgi:hypothetical protein
MSLAEGVTGKIPSNPMMVLLLIWQGKYSEYKNVLKRECILCPSVVLPITLLTIEGINHTFIDRTKGTYGGHETMSIDGDHMGSANSKMDAARRSGKAISKKKSKKNKLWTSVRKVAKIVKAKRQEQVKRQSSLKNFGRFSDGTPITPASLTTWRRLPLKKKTERNLALLEQQVVRWHDLAESDVPRDDELQDDLRSQDSEVGEAEVDAGAQQDSKASSSSASSKEPKLRPVVIFLHIPKAGGTTLEYILGKNYSINRSLHVNAPELEVKPYLLFKHDVVPSLIMGHHKINSILYQLIDRPIIHITMLRDPIKRVISYYDYRRAGSRHRFQAEMKQITLREFVESKEFVELEDAQTRRLTGRLKHERNLLKLGGKVMTESERQSMLDEAKYTLTERISFFGITEEYTRFLLMAKRLMGWDDIYYTRRNVSQKKTDVSEIDESVMDIIKERNQMDIALYDYAKELFDARWQQMGIPQKKVEKYEALNESYSDLLWSARSL